MHIARESFMNVKHVSRRGTSNQVFGVISSLAETVEVDLCHSVSVKIWQMMQGRSGAEEGGARQTFHPK